MFSCGRCNSKLTDGVVCSSCQQHFDFLCAGISEASYRKLGKNKSSWRCPECKAGVSTSRITQNTPPMTPKTDRVHEELLRITSKLTVLDSLSEDIKSIKTEIYHLKTSLELAHDSIKSFTDKINLLETRVNKVEAHSAEIPALLSSVTKLQHDMREQEQWLRVNNVEIKGIPLKKNENLLNIAQDIGKAVECSIKKEDINLITRVPTRQKDTEKPIILSFINRYLKEEFLTAMRKRKELTASSLGFNSENKVYINDHLTVYYKNLLSKAKSLKKESDFQFLWVKNSKILARKSPTSKVFAINSEADLLKIH